MPQVNGTPTTSRSYYNILGSTTSSYSGRDSHTKIEFNLNTNNYYKNVVYQVTIDYTSQRVINQRIAFNLMELLGSLGGIY